MPTISQPIWPLSRKMARLLTFDLRSLLAAVVASACVCGFVHAATQARNRALREIAPLVLRTTSTFCTSEDGLARALRADHGGLVTEAGTGEQIFSVELLWHPYDGRLYAIDRLSHRRNQEWQRWNPLTSLWEACDEGLLAFVHSTRGLLPFLLTGFLLAGGLCISPRWRPWLGGVVLTLGVACVVSVALGFVPIMWRASSISAAGFNRDGSMLATASVHGTDSAICLWDVATGKGLAKLDVSNAYADFVAFSTDGKNLTVRSAGNNVVVWELDAKR